MTDINLSTIQFPTVCYFYDSIVKVKTVTSVGELELIKLGKSIIDYVDTAEFYKRRNLLMYLDSQGEIEFNKGFTINSIDELDSLFTNAIQHNNTGIISISPVHVHAFGTYASYSRMLKRYQEQFTCVGFIRNNGKCKDELSLVCTTANGEEFRVKMRGNKDYQLELVRNINNVIGKKVKVEYSKMTNKPNHPIGIEIV